MSRLTIDTGTAGNAATGDSLRAAFTKVNTNFTELYAELGGDSLDAISFNNNAISTDITNANLILSGNGTGGVVIEDIEITGSTINTLTTNNNLTLDTNGTGKVIINGLSFPTADGTAGQVLKTDGAGNLSFTAVDPGAITFVGDDSTGIAVSIGETFKIAGGTGLTSAVSGDTITLDIDATVATLTGSQELTNKTITFGSNTISGTAAQFNTGVVDADFATLDGSEVLTNKTISTASNTITGTVITIVGDDSTGTAVNIGETFKIAGAGSVTTAVSGDTLTITGSASAQGITFVGDDSTGTRVSDGESFKVTGTQNITTAVSGDTLTITGPNLSSYLTNSTITVVGDDSTGTTLNTGETIMIAGGTGLTSVVSGDTITLDIDSTVTTLTGSQELTNKTLTTPKIDLIKDANGNEILSFSTTASATDYLVVKNGIGTGVPLHIYAEGDSANIGVHLQPKGSGIFTISDGTDFNKGIRFRSSSSAASAITLIDAVSTAGRVVTLPDATDTLVGRATTDTLTNKSISLTTNTITGTVITIVGDDSTGTAVNIGETFKIAGAGSVTTAVSGDTLTITGSKDIDVNSIASSDSSAIQINDAINVSGAGTFHGSVRFNAGYTEKINALTSSSTITVNCAAASIHTVTLAVSTGFVITGLPTGGTVTLIITQGGSGSYTATFGTDTSTTVKFPGGAPTLSTAVGAIDVVTIFNDGTNYLGNIAKAYA